MSDTFFRQCDIFLYLVINLTESMQVMTAKRRSRDNETSTSTICILRLRRQRNRSIRTFTPLHHPNPRDNIPSQRIRSIDMSKAPCNLIEPILLRRRVQLYLRILRCIHNPIPQRHRVGPIFWSRVFCNKVSKDLFRVPVE